MSTEQLPYLKCPLHTVLKLTPVAYGKGASRTLTWWPVWLSARFLDCLQTPPLKILLEAHSSCRHPTTFSWFAFCFLYITNNAFNYFNSYSSNITKTAKSIFLFSQ